MRHCLLLGCTTLACALPSVSLAQVSDPTRVIPSSGLSAPAAGATVTDPAFAVTIRRLTNRGQNGGLATAEYPQIQAINADETRVLVSTETDYRVMDLATGQDTHVGINLSMPRWHPIDADVLIGFSQRSGNNIQFQHVQLLGGGMAMTTDVVNISALGFRGLTLGSWEDASADGRYIPILNQANGGDQAAIIDTVMGTVRTQISTGGLDWVGVSPSGQYMAVQYANRGTGPTSGLVIHDAATGQALGHATDHHEHGDLGVDAQGQDVFGTVAWTDLCANGEAPCFSVSPLPDAVDTNRLANRRVFDPPVGNYTTCRAHRRGGFCLSSDDYGGPGGAPFRGEIWLNRMSDGAVLRLAHHRSSSGSYYNLVRPVLSPTGRYALYTSDWARPNSSNQADLYVIDLSPYLDTFLVNTPPADAGVPEDSGPAPDMGVADAGFIDGGFDEAGQPVDSGPAPDTGVTPRDSGVHPDGGMSAPDTGRTTTTSGPRGTSGGCTSVNSSDVMVWALLGLFLLGGLRRRAWAICLVVGFVPSASWAADVQADPTDYLNKAAQLSPGDTLHLAPGEYMGCLVFSGVHGEPGRPITVTGPEAPPLAVFRGAPCSNPGNPRRSVIIFLEDASYITIKNLELDAQDMAVSGVRGGFGTTPVHNITLEGLYIHDNDVNNQPSGISSFATAWNWVIRGNRIENTGLGLYLGDSDGTDPFIAATIEHNVVINPRGYGMQIKHQNPRVMVAGMPQGDSVSYIRHNVFMKESNAANGDDARPNLLVGAFPSSGVGVDDRYEIYGNLLYENQTDSEPLFQGEGNVAFHDNVLVNSFAGAGVLIRRHNGAPRTIDIYRNTILTEGMAISISGAEGAISQRVEGNAVYANGMPAIMGGAASDNVQGTLLDAVDALVDPTPVLGQLDVYPASDATLKGTPLDWSAYADHADLDRDFNGSPRDNTWRGAYAGSGSNPGWVLAADMKPPAGSSPGPDAGIEADSGTPALDAEPGVDAGPVRDAVVGDEAGVIFEDAGVLDAGTEVDAGGTEATGTSGGCRALEPSAVGGALLLGLVLLLWRRRTGLGN